MTRTGLKDIGNGQNDTGNGHNDTGNGQVPVVWVRGQCFPVF